MKYIHNISLWTNSFLFLLILLLSLGQWLLDGTTNSFDLKTVPNPILNKTSIPLMNQ